MKKNIFSLNESGKKVARLAGNRDLDEKIVKEKMSSMKSCGMLVPAIVVDADKAMDEHLGLIDFKTQKVITKEEAKDYVVLLDANHRYAAYSKLVEDNQNLESDKKYKGEFYMTYPLNEQIEIPKMLSEINISTNPWKAQNYVNGALLFNNGEKNPPLLLEIQRLTKEGFSLSTASKWLTFTQKVNKQLLNRAINGDLDEILNDKKKAERGKRLLEAAKCFSKKFLKARLLIDWIIKEYDKAEDSEKQNIIDRITDFMKTKLTEENAKFIEKSKKEGNATRESIVFTRLDALFNDYNQKG